jgi:trehalose 6-phosphate synthase
VSIPHLTGELRNTGGGRVAAGRPAPQRLTWPYMRESAGRRVLVASNRGPVSYTQGDDGRLVGRRGGGGMVSGLSSVADTEDMLWVCAALSDGDRAAARKAGDGGLLPWEGTAGDSAVRMLDLPEQVFDRAYNAVANSTLWFVHHMLYDTPNKPAFGLQFQGEWADFRAYNEAFAAALAEAPGPADGQLRAVIQDYHLCLAPRMLASRASHIRIAHFSHTPWAPPDYYRLLPDQAGREILAGILGAHHAGFLCQRWADAFLDCCEAFLDCKVDRARREVQYDGHLTTVGVHPLGVDGDQLRERAAAQDVQDRMATIAEQTAGRTLIVRVDRTELSKNIVRGLEAYRELLHSHPEWHGRITKLAFAYPSRDDLPEYRAYAASVQRLARQIQDEFAIPGWEPLILQVDDDYPRSLAAMRMADVLLVNPVRDGMNLVAKEGPILSDHGCAIVLSTEAGAAAELGDEALLVNPFDVSETAEALHRALAMTQQERARRSQVLAAAATAMPPQRWFASQLDALDQQPVRP